MRQDGLMAGDLSEERLLADARRGDEATFRAKHPVAVGVEFPAMPLHQQL